MKWILFLTLWTYPTTVSMVHEFNTKNHCINAAETIKKEMAGMGNVLRYVCVEKGMDL